MDVVADDEVARVIVRDQGIGIADADQEAIFQLFERARTRQPGSFGVGLWLVRKLCRAMGGGDAAVDAAGGTIPWHHGRRLSQELGLSRGLAGLARSGDGE